MGTRPEIIRLSRVMACLDRYLDHVLIHTGQNYDYEVSQIFFDQLELRAPDVYLEAAAQSAVETIGQTLIKIDPVLDRIRPDALLVLGDTNSCLAAIAAKKKKIPIFHMEAGNRCFDQRVPEEANRKIVDHLADVNMTYSNIAREYLLREGLPADRVIKTGSPMFEVLQHYAPGITSSDVMTQLGLQAREFYLVSCHREENVDPPDRLQQLVDLVNGLARATDRRIVFSAHPRTRIRLEAAGAELHERIDLMKPLGFLDYARLQTEARAVLSDSGTITEESTILNFPALNLRQAHERPEGMEEAAVMLVGLDLQRVLQGLDILEHQPRGEKRMLRMVADYEVPNLSEKIVRLILSYVDYVNRTVWSK